MRIYKVTTPAGISLVEANSQSQAINMVIEGQVTATVAGGLEVAQLIEQGHKIIRPKPAPAKPESQNAGTTAPQSGEAAGNTNAGTAPQTNTAAQ
jgi:hypothetical protein